MNRSTFISLLTLAPWLAAQTSAKKLRVLLMTGGHAFERLPFLALFLANPAIELTEAPHEEKSATAWEREDLLTYDVIVLYDMMQAISEAGQKQFAAARAKGIGLVVLHHALVAYQKWPDYESIIGGAYPEADGEAGKVTEAVGYQHNVEIPVTVLNKRIQPPQASIISPSQTKSTGASRRETTSRPCWEPRRRRSGKVLAWAKPADKSRLVYLQLGHGPPLGVMKTTASFSPKPFNGWLVNSHIFQIHIHPLGPALQRLAAAAPFPWLARQRYNG